MGPIIYVMNALRAIIVALLLLSMVPFTYADSTCNDIELSPLSVNFSENKENKSITFTIENEGDEDFELDDVRVQESSPFFDVSVDDFPNEIQEGDHETLRLEYDTVNVNGNEQDNFTIQLEGEFPADDEECSFSDLTFSIDVTIQEDDEVCSMIEIIANDVSVTENSNITHTITVRNNSSNDFTFQGFDVFDDGDSFSANAEPPFSDSDFEKELTQNSSNTYTIEINAQGVSQDETDFTFVEIRGEFEDGEDCSFNDISGEFEVTVEDTGIATGICTEINVNVPFITVHAGETSSHAFTVANNSSQNFIVDEYVITDKNYQVEFVEISNPYLVEFETSEELAFNAIGYSNVGSYDSNAFLTLKGHFTDGGTCLVNAKKMPYQFIGNENGTCNSFYVGLKPITILKGNASVDVLLNNPLNFDAKLFISSDKGNVSPSTIVLPANTLKQYTFSVSNTQENQTLLVKTSMQGCIIPDVTSKLLFSGLENAPVQFVAPPATMNVAGAKEFAIHIENNSAFTQEVEITLIAKPGNQVFTKTTFISGLDEPLIYLPTNILHGKSLAVIQLKSAGYIVSHTIQLENTPIAQPAPSDNDDEIGGAFNGIVTGLVTSGFGFWLGVLVLVVLIGLWYAAQPKVLVKSERILFGGSQNVPAEEVPEEDVEEAWMNPPKATPKSK